MNVGGKALFSVLWLRHRSYFKNSVMDWLLDFLGTLWSTTYAQRWSEYLTPPGCVISLEHLVMNIQNPPHVNDGDTRVTLCLCWRRYPESRRSPAASQSPGEGYSSSKQICVPVVTLSFRRTLYPRSFWFFLKEGFS